MTFHKKMATPRDIISAMKKLISCETDPLAPSGWMERLQYNLKNTRSDPIHTSSTIRELKFEYQLDFQGDLSEDAHWGFVLESLALLLYLHRTLNSTVPSEEEVAALLSLSDQKTIKNLCQFTASLGLYPYIDIGPHIDKRAATIISSDVTDSVKRERLCTCLHSLCNCLTSEEMLPTLLQTLLPGLLAGLFKIIYKRVAIESPPPPPAFFSTKLFQEHLENLLRTLPHPVLVKELLSLQVMAKNPRTKLSWLRKACGEHLSRILMEANGVQSVLRGIFEASTGNAGLESESVTESSENWRKCQAIGQILSNCPLQADSVEKYYSLACPQILSLIELPPDGVGRHFLRVAVCTMTQMLSKQYELAMTYTVIPLLKPLQVLTEDKELPDITQLRTSLDTCLINLNRVLSVIEPSSSIMTPLVSYLPLLFDIWRHTRKNDIQTTRQSKQALVSILKSSDVLTQLSFFKHILHSQETKLSKFRTLRSDIIITSFNEGGLTILKKGKEEEGEEEENKGAETSHASSELMSKIGTCITELVEGELKSTGINTSLFMHCLEYMGMLLVRESGLQQGKEEKTTHNSTLMDEPQHESSTLLLEWEESTSTCTSEAVKFSNALVLYVLASLCEGMDLETMKSFDLHSMMQSLVLIVKSHSFYCKRDVMLIRDEEAELLGNLTGGHVTLSIAFGLLSAVLASDDKISPTLRPLLTNLLPYLESLSCRYPDKELSGLAEDLRICIATLGSVWSEKMSKKATEMATKQEKKQERPSKSRKEETKKVEGERLCPTTHATVSRPLIEEIETTDTRYTQAIRDTNDPLIPVKGHGLQTLGQLVRGKDSETLSHIDRVTETFMTHMRHSDTYVYLPALQGLVELAAIQPDSIIPYMCKEYAQFNKERKAEKSSSEGLHLASQREEKSLEWRVKLGEALVRAARECGELLPKYSQTLLAAVLSNTKHTDPLIRSSALSNLADICSNLKWSFTPIKNEVIDCLERVLKSDTDPSARRAAISVAKHLFKGLDTSMDKVLEGGSLLSLYRMLKFCESSDPDQLTRTHAQAALGELGEVMKQLLFPPTPQKLSKKISILDHMV